MGKYRSPFHAPLNSGVSSLDISFSNVEGGENILDDLENVAFNASDQS